MAAGTVVPAPQAALHYFARQEVALLFFAGGRHSKRCKHRRHHSGRPQHMSNLPTPPQRPRIPAILSNRPGLRGGLCTTRAPSRPSMSAGLLPLRSLSSAQDFAPGSADNSRLDVGRPDAGIGLVVDYLAQVEDVDGDGRWFALPGAFALASVFGLAFPVAGLWNPDCVAPGAENTCFRSQLVSISYAFVGATRTSVSRSSACTLRAATSSTASSPTRHRPCATVSKGDRSCCP